MIFSWVVLFLTILIVLIEIFFAWKEKILLPSQNKKISLPLFRHGGIVVGDLILLPIFNGLVVPFFHFSSLFYFCIIFIAISITFIMHRLWWPKDSSKTSFMFPNWKKSQKNKQFWYRDVSISGWVHFVFMATELVIIGLYVFASVPKIIALSVSAIFFVFIPVSHIAPEIILKRQPYVILIDSIILYAIVIIVAYAKLKIN